MLSIGLLKIKFGDGRAQSAGFGRCVVISSDERGPIENSSNDIALDSDPFPVNDANVAIPMHAGFDEVFLDDFSDLPRWNRMQIEDIADLDPHRLIERVVDHTNFIRLRFDSPAEKI